ncbi:double-strand break repair protein AddB [Sphingobium sufflavum]|uniref:double-strand break repair protein AddB n=1 Tax=Sphingobium sufflavum TaxID=1129547 RepID=UPI001F3AD25C|nr:double-strand break repair protein AddB [Sphingobium sufflavum]MCE7797046.1 double-strand break repair protein AddB [Sphingobium sufflavum]
MADAGRPAIFTIPAHRAFADALVAGVLASHGKAGRPDAIAQGLILLPNNRAVRAVRDAFVRASGGGLLLPRLVPIGDADLSERVGLALDAMEENFGAEGAEIPPAIDPMRRTMILARLVQTARAAEGKPVDTGEAMRLGLALGTTLDQLLVERKTPHDVASLPVAEALQGHWQTALATLNLLLEAWPRELAARGCIDSADRRNRLFDALARRWRIAPPPGYLIAAGITTSAPAIAALLRVVSQLPSGQVVFPDLDLNLTEEQWDAIAPLEPVQAGQSVQGGGPRERAAESHPQFALKLLLDRMGVHRDEVALWRWGSAHDARAARGKAITNAMLPARLTGVWRTVPDSERVLKGVTALEAVNPAEEAQAIAIALREVLETPEKTAALVTPDRDLATRVSAHLRRWGIAADDSAGRPLAQLPSGMLLTAIASAAAERFSPVPLLALLKHPLVRAGDERLAWLDNVRLLDLMLRGPRPGPGLAGIGARLADPPARQRDLARRLGPWWAEVAALLTPLEESFGGDHALSALIACVREAAGSLSGEQIWAGYQGRSASDLIAAIEAAAPDGPPRCDGQEFVALLGQLLAGESVRPPQGGHPRIAILGLIEARLQQSDLMILAGLNEGVWPALPSPDPWLAPRVRYALGLPGLERRIGLSGHDLANGLGAPEVIISRALRDASAPTVASRFWLRLRALAGPKWEEERRSLALARAIDAPAAVTPVATPEPCPPQGARPLDIAVTDVDRLKADPYGFYARRILRLSPLDVVDADPSAAWRGTAVHDVLEQWLKEDDARPAALMQRARDLLASATQHPVMRILWQPRLMLAIEWIAQTVAAQRDEGRAILFGEEWGEASIAGVKLYGKADRVDRAPDGSIIVVDYKTGKAPSAAQVKAGYSLQLGLLGLLAREGGFKKVEKDARASGFEYWSLGRNTDGGFGKVASPVDPNGTRGRIPTDQFVDLVASQFIEVAQTYLTGMAPFAARPHPDAPVFTDYDHLMRLDEWFGRGSGA